MVKNTKILAPKQLFTVVVLYKIKPVQNTTDITEITKKIIKLSTLHKIQIGENFSPIVYSTNLTLCTSLTIVLALNFLLTYTGHQSEQIIAPIHLLGRKMHRVLKTCIMSFLNAHNSHWFQLHNWEHISR